MSSQECGASRAMTEFQGGESEERIGDGESINRDGVGAYRIVSQGKASRRSVILPKIKAPAEVESREENKKEKKRGGEERRERGIGRRWMDGWMEFVTGNLREGRTGQARRGTAARNPKKEGRACPTCTAGLSGGASEPGMEGSLENGQV